MTETLQQELAGLEYTSDLESIYSSEAKINLVGRV